MTTGKDGYPPRRSKRPQQWYPSYVVVIEHRVDECGWDWAVWTEDKTTTLATGHHARSRRSAVRKVTRAIRTHARQRGDRPDWWWEDTAGMHDAEDADRPDVEPPHSEEPVPM